MPGKEFVGFESFRFRLAFALISRDTVRITKIRDRNESPGLSNYESCVLNLIQKISNGTYAKISDTGTTLTFSPGTLTGGSFELDTDPSRGIGYYLELLLLLAPFCKQPIEAVLRGVTNNSVDPSPDMIKLSWLPTVRRFLDAAAAESLEVKINKRGAHPSGGGEVHFTAKPVMMLKPIKWIKCGKVYRIRGVAWTCLVSPAVAQRMIGAAKTILCKFLPDVYIAVDSRKEGNAGSSPGFGLTLVALTKEGTAYSAETISNPSGSDAGPTVSEDLGVEAAGLLCEQIYRGGCVDSGCQALALSLMALEGGRNVSSLVTGTPTQHSIDTLRLIADFFKIEFQLKPNRSRNDEAEDGEEQTASVAGRRGGDTLICTCVGAGFVNMNKAIR